MLHLKDSDGSDTDDIDDDDSSNYIEAEDRSTQHASDTSWPTTAVSYALNASRSDIASVPVDIQGVVRRVRPHVGSNRPVYRMKQTWFCDSDSDSTMNTFISCQHRVLINKYRPRKTWKEICAFRFACCPLGWWICAARLMKVRKKRDRQTDRRTPYTVTLRLPRTNCITDYVGLITSDILTVYGCWKLLVAMYFNNVTDIRSVISSPVFSICWFLGSSFSDAAFSIDPCLTGCVLCYWYLWAIIGVVSTLLFCSECQYVHFWHICDFSWLIIYHMAQMT